MKPMASRTNRVDIREEGISTDHVPRPVTPQQEQILTEVVKRMRNAREADRSVIIAFGAHSIKNGLGPVLISLMEKGWLTHLATNGAGIIHDWEFSYGGSSSEHVGKNVASGTFGNWEETGYTINLAINLGAYMGMGYGEAVGRMIEEEALIVPSVKVLRQEVLDAVASDPDQAAAAADMLTVVERFGLSEGLLRINHPYKEYSPQAAAYRLGILFTGHPMFGQDIIYNHPMNHGGLLGRAAERDFLAYAESVRNLDGGVYLSVGSAVMSPMIFEKSLSMARNIASQEGESIERHFILVADLAPSTWDWSGGEPPEDSPEYYMRYNKSFSRMGGSMEYLSIDNRDLLLHLWRLLEMDS